MLFWFNKYSVQVVLLTIFAVVFLFSGLNSSPLLDWDENIYAEASRQMVLRDNYLNIYINGHPFAEKPPFFFWLEAAAYKIFGINEFAARFPSACAGLVMVLFMMVLGKRLVSGRFGLLWALIYLTSFLPAVFARSAVIDHTFNMWITLATFGLYLYDHWRGLSLGQKPPPAKDTDQNSPFHQHPSLASWLFLVLASVCMGLAVLTKGPLGGVIPLVGFLGYKIYCRSPRLHWGHAFICATISLTLASSWYLVNWILYGATFLEGFLQFQGALFKSSLEGHTGPFYYHFIAVALGFLPWSPFLFNYRREFFTTKDDHAFAMQKLCFSWILFVLILFSFVSTKLPHYSASVYIPLSMILAYVLEKNRLHGYRNAVGAQILWIFSGSSLGVAFLCLPQLLEYYVSSQNLGLKLVWDARQYISGLALLFGVLIGFWFLKRAQFGRTWVVIAMMVFCFTQGLWRWQIPLYTQVTQQPLITLVREAHEQNAELFFYRFVSFAALYYGQQSIEMLHTYKFPGDPTQLNAASRRLKIVIAEKKLKVIERLYKEHPSVLFQKNFGAYAVFTVPATL